MLKFQYIGGCWDDEKDVSDSFCDPEVLDYDLIVAVYDQGEYDGTAYVLAAKDGQLFEVQSGHCSCYGLEDSWCPSLITIDYLRQRLDKGGFPGGDEVTDLVRQYVSSCLPN